MRLDKWLWAARFFKTRALATEAVNGGKVHLHGQRTKPGKEVKEGTRLRIHKGSLEWNITVEVLPKQRRPAKEAVTFYSESEESINAREKVIAEEKAIRAAMPVPTDHRPIKKERRQIHRFKRIEK
ncbi:RNA-binding S4 domain-containing protein [Solemya velum gill symbiont]|uniref:RNA-binding S4 domain-containing protein n=1 Tax=Solemya velum gill symbiont TaxID=2340 RepID=UPI000995F937|nr:S4 domain-containing protein [Solemya velum gill symbiont]OOY59060.1 RNA-binding protein S4 [Solemya velum gill symbiont]OOY73185.1 RNA-binding protein S4 [Solemya velum gill symbiont]OOY76278.1 RNA-binding protein S4 [Solemya velum gill symbiont]OOY81139.1 RNA-binding protein S4 [Solemya velum gill symbiont]OOY84948.1 RNA-binding protein S4 [Solemya velum gill symbiont]